MCTVHPCIGCRQRLVGARAHYPPLANFVFKLLVLGLQMSDGELFGVASEWIQWAALWVVESSLLPGSTLWRWLLPTHAETKLVTRWYVVSVEALSVKVWLGRWIWIITHETIILVVEVERTVRCYHALVYVSICCLSNGWLIKIVDKRWIVKFRLNVIGSICVFYHCWFFRFLVTLCRWSLWPTRVYNSTSAWILWIAQLLLLIECILSVSHSGIILPEHSTRFSVWRLLLSESWWPIIQWPFV